MSRDIYTRCPNCHTVFRVTEQHLELAEGKVRCGACMSIFKGTDHLMRPKSKPENSTTAELSPQASGVVSYEDDIDEPIESFSSREENISAQEDSLGFEEIASSPEVTEPTESSFDKLADYQPEVNVTDEGQLMHATAHAELDIHRSSHSQSEKTEYPIDSFALANEAQGKHSNEQEQSLTKEATEIEQDEFDDDLLFDDNNGLEDDSFIAEELSNNQVTDSLDNILEQDSFSIVDHKQNNQESSIAQEEIIEEKKLEVSSQNTNSHEVKNNTAEEMSGPSFDFGDISELDDLPGFDDFLEEEALNTEQSAAHDLQSSTEEPHQPSDSADQLLIKEPTNRRNKTEGFLDELDDILDDPSNILLDDDDPSNHVSKLADNDNRSLEVESTSLGSAPQDPTISEMDLPEADYDPFDENNIEEALFHNTPEDYHTGELSMDQLNESLKDEDFDPDPLDEFDEMVYEKSHRVKWLALSGMLIAFLSWGGYQLWTDRQQLAWNDTWGGTIHTMCSILPCNIQPRRNVDVIELLQRTVQPSEEIEDFSEFSLILRNNASFAQPYPSIEIHFTDTDGKSVARETFSPNDYLEPEVQSSDMPSGQRVYVLIKAKNPSANAFGFEFTFK